MDMIELKVPNIGGSTEVNVAEIYVKVGDTINIDDNLIMLETDKASMDVPATQAGKVVEIMVKVGSKLNEGDVILKLEAERDMDTKVNQSSAKNDQDHSLKTSSTPENNNTPVIPKLEGDIECDVVVLGAGPGGYTAAFRAADLGKNVVLIERYSTLGGVCLNVGCIPSKALLHVARVINEAEEMSEHGVVFGAPKLDIDKIRKFKDGVVNKLTGGLAVLSKQRKVQVIVGEGQFTSPYTFNVVTANGNKTIRFTNAIIAAGSEPFKITGFPVNDPRVVDSTGALQLKDIPEKMLIIGGGIIGLEMAEVYSSLGSKITIVEFADGLIPGADRDVIKVLENRIKKRYAAIYTKTKCTKVETQKAGVWVTFEGPNAPTEPQKFDKVLVAAGRRPNGNKISAEKAGVVVNPQGFIPVDKQGRTNINHIFAIGDIVGQPMLAHKATHEGRIAAENCAGMKSYFDARVIPGIAYTDPEIA
nr:dihydrolipoyl dehydrogenase [Burkholderiales bacterium]